MESIANRCMNYKWRIVHSAHSLLNTIVDVQFIQARELKDAICIDRDKCIPDILASSELYEGNLER